MVGTQRWSVVFPSQQECADLGWDASTQNAALIRAHKKKGVSFEISRAGSNKQTLQINIKANTEGMLIQFGS